MVTTSINEVSAESTYAGQHRRDSLRICVNYTPYYLFGFILYTYSVYGPIPMQQLGTYLTCSLIQTLKINF